MRSQKTIQHVVTFEGIGLHTGRFCRVQLRPASRDEGITFIRTDKHAVIKAHVGSVIDTAFATTIGANGAKIRTVEHILSACTGLGIDNIVIEVEGPEIPIMDGSSAELIRVIREAGVARQAKKRPFLRIRKPLIFEDGHSRIAALPYNGTRFTYSLVFSHYNVGEQKMSLDINEDSFAREIAPARTFGFLHDVERLQMNGFARGGSLDNAVILGEQGVLNSSGLRFKDEFVRHKILDSIGDFSLLGFPIYGHVIAHKSGHTTNVRFMKKLLASPDTWDIITEKTRPAPSVLHINA